MLDFEHDKKNKGFNLLLDLYDNGIRIQNFIDYLYSNAMEDFPESNNKEVQEILKGLKLSLQKEKEDFDKVLEKNI
jgi:hypothetical protein